VHQFQTCVTLTEVPDCAGFVRNSWGVVASHPVEVEDLGVAPVSATSLGLCIQVFVSVCLRVRTLGIGHLVLRRL
jgi:hypothetical protein